MSRIRTVLRTVEGANITFDHEPNLPKLNNLAMHVSDCKKRKVGDQVVDEQSSVNLNLKHSANMMAVYLKQGELNPQIIPTQAGFICLFAAWVLDESLPWMTSEAPSLQLLFNYLKIRFTLPTNTSMHTQLSKIYDKLHGKVVHLFTVSITSHRLDCCFTTMFQEMKSRIAYTTDTWTTKQMIYTFSCTAALYINDDWELVEHIVDFKPLEVKEHEGIHAGYAFFAGARQRGGLSKICRHNIYSSLYLPI